MELPPTILYEKKDHIAIVTINRPEAMNSFTAEMLTGLEDAFAAFNEDPELWVAILTAAGDKSFSTGLDLKEAIPMLTGGDALGFEDTTKRQFSDIFKPIIAAVNGHCIAGGMEMLQGTDLRIAAEHATLVWARCAGASSRWAARTSGCRARSPGPWPWRCCWSATPSTSGAPTRSD